MLTFALFYLATTATGSFLRVKPAAEDAVEMTGDTGCVDGLVFKDTLDITRNPPGKLLFSKCCF